MKKIIIFASGSGTNAENLILKLPVNNFKINWHVFTNNSNAGIISKCKNLNIKCEIFNKQQFSQSLIVQNKILEIKPDIIILAGFLLKIPHSIIDLNYPIINIHPSLLPKYGGKGMYGSRVHDAVIKNNETISGITIHRVNINYDEGEVVLQKSIKLNEKETPFSLAKKIHDLEMKYFPEIIKKLIGIG